MRLRRSPCRSLLLVAVAVAVVTIACGDSGIAPGTGDRAISATSGAPSTAAPTTGIRAADGLDCESDERMTTIVEPAPGLTGYDTPEKAVLAIASAVSVAGTPKLLEVDSWIIVSDTGFAVARTDVEPWHGGWFAGEILACARPETGS